jgi:hypothetical protein
MPQMTAPEAYIQFTPVLFTDDGEVTDPSTEELLNRLVLMRTSFLGKVHFMPSKYDPEMRAKAVRLVLERRDDYPSE